MRVNIFSGGRRIAIVVGILAVACAGGFAWIVNPVRHSMTYRVVEGKPIEIGGSCDYANEAVGSAYRDTGGPALVYLTLCLPSAIGADANRIASLIPFASGAAERANSAMAAKEKARYETTAYSVLGAAAAVWILTAVIGWIVRGFLGVPGGRDSRLSTSEAEESLNRK